MNLYRSAAAAVFLLALALRPAPAQVPIWSTLPSLGGDAEDRVRLGQLLGRGEGDRFLLRSASEALDSLPGVPGQLRWGFLAPEVVVVSNSAIPFSLNDGAMWAARGWSEDIRAGLRLQWGRISLVLAPDLVATENLPYQLPPPEAQLPRPPGRSLFSTPWHVGDYSIDQPLRFGERGQAKLVPGQSTLAVDLGPVTAGLSTENEWWGPGIRNAIVMSNNAAGIPRAFVRTSRPVQTRLGTFAARWFLGSCPSLRTSTPSQRTIAARSRRSPPRGRPPEQRT